jgi:hypothetical protein
VYDAVERLYGGGSFSSAILAPNKKIAADKAVESLSEGVEKVQITPTVHENSISIPVTTRFTAVPKAQRDKPRAPAPSNPGHDNYTVTPETYRDWVANVTLEKYSLGGSGSVAFFLGPIDEIPVDRCI